MDLADVLQQQLARPPLAVRMATPGKLLAGIRSGASTKSQQACSKGPSDKCTWIWGLRGKCLQITSYYCPYLGAHIQLHVSERHGDRGGRQAEKRLDSDLFASQA